ncbi:hypothetical protein [Microbispora sp. H11081]|uniref:hypothetical protein n=1 Tax=Microbispora sp. H11081 TaxID=2729107 RepID=UPI0014745D1C|nr:hypothetical protein [Microbispora sp. H11081]
MNGQFYRRRWDESRGDEFDDWGHSVWYFEVDDDGCPVRQVEVYDAGPVLRYGPEHKEDRYGGLGQASLFDPDEDWKQFVITRDMFERVWESPPGG